MRKFKRVFQVLGVICLTICLLTVSNEVLKRKYSKIEYDKFFDKAQEIDVLFYGPSVLHNAVSPMQLYQDYGITSYNMGNDSERLTMTYYDIINSLDYAKPKVVVVELTAMGWAGSKRDNSLKDHNFLDALPLSINKIKEVVDLFEKEEYLEYLIPFTLYHSRWNELTEEDFEFESDSVMYGVDFKTGIKKTKEPKKDDYEKSRFGDVEAETKTLNNIINVCKDNDIELIFIYLPSGIRGGDQKIRDFCADFLLGKGVEFVDMLNMNIVDYSRDFVDGGHVNYFGAKKVTDYLGKMLVEKYCLEDHRNDSSISKSWDDDLEEYNEEVRKIETNFKEEYEKANK